MTARSLICLAIALPLLAERPAGAQPTPAGARPDAQAASTRLRVFLDCRNCFQEYLRDQISWVDFVRQPQDADVHLLSSERPTGAGGRELVLRFVGRGRFADLTRELRVVSEPAEPESLRRTRVLRTTMIGLLDYMARDGLPAGLEVNVRPESRQDRVVSATRDRWNLWVFSVGTGASIDAEESNRSVEWDLNLTADRVTDRWKIGFGLNLDEERESFDLDEDDPLHVRRTERSTRWFIARSLGPHWSVGFDGRIAASSFGNTRLLAQTAPAVEFSIFPYREYATRQFVIQYQVGMESARYREITLFGRIEETLGRHAWSANLDQRQPWGSLDAGIEWSQYLHDASKYRLEFDGELSLRIVRGLSIDVEAFASRQRDQLALPRRGATSEEVLLRLRELHSGYEFRFSVGLRYSFGSLFNNVVNPRFGNRGAFRRN
ncbi:MAG: hypothetical protein HY654_08955 [Acidobacteria bacterium]|nr:hypothetical protein [Acidobacteriota bacterium]